MGKLRLMGDTSGYVDLVVPAASGTTEVTIPATTDTLVGKVTVDILSNKTLESPVINTPNMNGSVITSQTQQASTSGTSIDFTSIPSWVKRITILLSGVSNSGGSNLLLQLGDSGGIEATGYVGGAYSPAVWAESTIGLLLTGTISSSSLYNGIATLILMDSSTNKWAFSSVGTASTVNTSSTGAGNKSLSGVLDKIRLTTVNGTDTFDAGNINVLYE